MPTYEYVCKDCGYEFEVFQSITEDPVTTCPQCGGPVRKKISGGAGLVFKGSGFYITDYKDKKSVSHNNAQNSASQEKKEKKEKKSE